MTKYRWVLSVQPTVGPVRTREGIREAADEDAVRTWLHLVCLSNRWYAQVLTIQAID